ALSLCSLFSFTAPPTTALYPLSLHDALPIFGSRPRAIRPRFPFRGPCSISRASISRSRASRPPSRRRSIGAARRPTRRSSSARRSEEHTSELQSPCNLVCRLLLEKKKNKQSLCIAMLRRIHNADQPHIQK